MSLSLLLFSVAAANPSDVYNNVVLDFTGPNCLYCQQMDPIVSRLQRQGYPIVKVDVTDKRHLFEQMNVTGMPTFVLIVDGREVTRRTGPMTPGELQRMCEQIPRHTNQPQNTAAAGGQPRPQAPDAATRAADDARSRFEFPFPARNEPAESLASNNGAAGAQPAAANPPPSNGLPSDWDRPVIRAQNTRTTPMPASPANAALASSARIRVRDNGGTVYGSATIIESRPGRTLLLTCGHIFRDLPETAEIVVDVFTGSQIEQYRGEVVNFDLESDVGLLAIATSDPLPASPVSSGKTAPPPGTQLYSVGCGGGDPPTRHDIRVTGFQRNTAPTYVECTGAPEQGRSGGGLFNEAGEIIGVCFAADAPRDRGLYASLPSVWRLLDRSSLSHLFRSSETPPARSADATAPAALANAGERPAGPSDEAPGVPLAGSAPPFAGIDAAAVDAGSDVEDQVAAVREALAHPEDTEVICVIRPRNRPAAASRIVVIHRASPKFVSFLTGELRQPRETARRVGFEEAGAPPEVGMASREAIAEDSFFSALRSEAEPFSHFQMVSAGKLASTPQPAVEGSRLSTNPAPSTHAEPYRRSAASRLPWPTR